MTDFRDETAGRFIVHRDDGFGHGAKPAGIRGKSVASDRLAPGGVVITAVTRCALFLDDDPAVNRKNAAPSHGTRGENADERIRMG